VEGTVMALYPDPTRPLAEGGAETLRLVAHELFHFWNGTHARPDTTKGEGWYKWFQEGMTEYVARRTLLREGFVEPAVFLAELNEALVSYTANPVARTATAAILAERYWDAEEYRQLPYVKGFLLGFLTDLRIREATAGRVGIDAWLRRALRPDLARGPIYDDAALLRALEEITGRDERAWYDAYALGAEPLPFEEACTRHGMTCTAVESLVFDLGFKAEPGIIDGALVTAVTPDSPAAEAGLEVGDRLTGGASYFPGDPTQDAIVEVHRGGTTVPLTWRPARTARIPLLEDTARARAVIESLKR
jgi:predicted metalloprotease with PDZ domain